MDENNDKVLRKEDWPTMSMNQLLDQKTIMFDKWMFLVENNFKWADQMKKGIDEIDAIIQAKVL